MSKQKSLLIGLILFSLGTRALSDEYDRKAVFVTEVGKTVTVLNPILTSDDGDAPDFGLLVFKSNNMTIKVNIHSVMTLHAKGNGEHEVKYLWDGKRHLLTGKLVPVTFQGKNKDGPIAIKSVDVKQMTVTPNPVSLPKHLQTKWGPEDWQRTDLVYDTVITLKDGTKIRAGKVERQGSYYSTVGYTIGGEYHHTSVPDVRLIVGNSVTAVPFTTVKLIQVEESDELTVTLRDGRKATYMPSKKGSERIERFGGWHDKGPFSVDVRLVKSIEFGVKSGR